jgi:hypothetical protein
VNVGTAAGVIIMKEKHVVAAFRLAQATAPERARPLESLGAHRGIATDRLRRRGVLREAQPGTYYLDESAWEALRGLRRRVAAVVLILVLGLILLGFATLTSR